jgi:hypothetical protein
MGGPFVYELIVEVEENIAHIGLIDVEGLRRKYGLRQRGGGF